VIAQLQSRPREILKPNPGEAAGTAAATTVALARACYRTGPNGLACRWPNRAVSFHTSNFALDGLNPAAFQPKYTDSRLHRRFNSLSAITELARGKTPHLRAAA